jgi:hypothetical protein
MLKKSEIQRLRERYLFGFQDIPKEVKSEDKRIFRAAAVYVLGQVLELPLVKTDKRRKVADGD